MVKVVVAGGRGRLGTLICDVVEAHPEFELAGVLGSTSAAEEFAAGEILVDVTTHAASREIVTAALQRGQKVLVGTSGWDEAGLKSLAQLAESNGTQVMVVPNFSLGSVLGSALAALAAPYFETVEVIETHHAAKIDSPSGTAIRTAEMIAERRAEAGKTDPAPFAEQPARGAQIAHIPVHALRSSGVVATQEVRYGGVGESLEIVHRTISPESYRAGINAALAGLQQQTKPLVVGLAETLGIKL